MFRNKKVFFTVLVVAVLIAVSMPIVTSPGLLDNIINTKQEQTITLSASVYDYNGDSYFCDESGNICKTDPVSGETAVLAELGAKSFTFDGNSVFYSTFDGKIMKYDVSSGKSSSLYSGSLCEESFGFCDKTLYFIGSDTLFKVKNKKAESLVSIEGLVSMKIVDEDAIILYVKNENYVDETSLHVHHEHTDECECLIGDDNDQFVTYLYSVKSDLVSPFDEHLEEVNSIFTPTEISERLNVTKLSSSPDVTTINGKVFPIDDTIGGVRAYYPVGSFFTYNGKSCTCHGRNTCVSNPPDCNCIRYWPNRSARQVDLASCQCYGFARFCMWYAYGFYDDSGKTYNAFGGSLNAGKWSANTIKNIFLEVGPGGHLRTGSGHSLFVMSVSSSGFITYECNKSRTGHNCEVYTRSWTWDSFYSTFRSRDLLFYNVPKNIDTSGQIIHDDQLQVGMYQTLADELNIRSGPSTSYSKLGQIPNGTPIMVTEVRKGSSYNWGLTTYNGIQGWVALEYAVYVSSAMTGIAITQQPDKLKYFEGDKFSTEGLEVSANFIDGTSLVIDGYTCSGYNMNVSGVYNVIVTCNGYTASFTIEVTKRKVYPTSVSLNYEQLVSIIGDNYNLEATLLPANTTQRSLVWTSSNTEVATVDDSGKLSILTPGTTEITVTTENDLTARFNVIAIKMPDGTEWSVTADGNPLPALPEGIDPQDYSVRYKIRTRSGFTDDWQYDSIANANGKDAVYQFRAFTLTFMSDGKIIETPKKIDVNTTIDITDKTLTKDGYIFAGWFKTNQAALALDKSMAYDKITTVKGDMTYYAGWIELGNIPSDPADSIGDEEISSSFELEDVGVKADSENVGLRFFVKISSSLISNLKKLHEDNAVLGSSVPSKDIGYGAVVVRKSSLKGELVKSSKSNEFLSSGGIVTVPAAVEYEMYNGYSVYSIYVTGYTKDYYETEFVVRPYITYKDSNGYLRTYYVNVTGEHAYANGYSTNLKQTAHNVYDNSDYNVRRDIQAYIFDAFE